MATWHDVRAAAPDLADAVEARFDAYRHKTIATLRRDGSPRISGIEVSFSDGEVLIGGMPNSLKCLDLLRDPRLALHSGTRDPDEEPGEVIDAKLAGRAVVVTDQRWIDKVAENAPPGPFHLFSVDITEVVHISLGVPADHMVIDSWHEGRGLTTVKRY